MTQQEHDSQSTRGATAPLRRVAVVAVHGVADQQPGATVRDTADLLLRGSPSGGCYSAVSEARLRIAVRPLIGESMSPVATSAQPPRPQQGWLGTRGDEFDERPDTIRMREAERRQAPPRAKAAAAADAAATVDPAELDREERRLEHDLMTEQLQGYRPGPKDRIYESLRLETTRSQGGAASQVHLYEMFWADLSRLGHRHIGVLFDLYQLLFFVVRIGRKNLDSALNTIEHAVGRRVSWRIARGCQNLAEHLLALWVPVLNLTLLALASVLLAQLLPEAGVSLPLWLIAALGLGLGVAIVSYRGREKLMRRATLWPLLLLPALVTALATGLLLRTRLPAWSLRPPAAAALAWLGAAVLILLLMSAYERRRSGAKWVTRIALTLMAAIYLPRLIAASGWREVFQAALGAAERFTFALNIVWPLFILLTLATVAAVMIAARLSAREPALASRAKRLRRAAGTTGVTLILPGLFVLLLNVALWQALVYVAKVTNVEFAGTTLYVLNDSDQDAAGKTDYDYVQELVDRAFLPEFDLGLAALALALVFALWGLLPAVRAEAAEPGAPTERSHWLGASLSSAFNLALRMSGVVLLLLVAAVLFVMVEVGRGRLATGIPEDGEFVRLLVAGIGLALVVAVSGSRGPLRFLAVGLRSVLDVALDVANWLRNKPLGETPRARICARYAALLRHLCQWRDPVDPTRGYDQIVILAHSQGTVITADLLRFIQEEGRRAAAGKAAPARAELASLDCLFGSDGASPSLPILLLTVGSPLRQLYSRRLPFHYGWARHDSSSEWPNREPEPAQLGVACWANGYGAGDYIGRYLWHRSAGDQRFASGDGDKRVGNDRREFCVGVAGHTSYWRQPAVAAELDWLIGRPGQ